MDQTSSKNPRDPDHKDNHSSAWRMAKVTRFFQSYVLPNQASRSDTNSTHPGHCDGGWNLLRHTMYAITQFQNVPNLLCGDVWFDAVTLHWPLQQITICYTTDVIFCQDIMWLHLPAASAGQKPRVGRVCIQPLRLHLRHQFGGCTSPSPWNAASRGNRSLLATSPWKSCWMGFWGTNAFSIWHELGCSFFKLVGSFCHFIIVFGLHSCCARHMGLMFLRLTALLCQSSWSFNAVNQLSFATSCSVNAASTKRTSCKVQKNSNQVLNCQGSSPFSGCSKGSWRLLHLDVASWVTNHATGTSEEKDTK